MRRRVALAALLGAASFLAAAREAAAWAPLDPSVPRWNKLPVGYYINRSTIPGSIAGFAVARVESGFETWANAGCTEWQVNLLGDTTDRYDYNDGKSVFHWISNSWPEMLGDVNSVIGVTLPVWTRDGAIFDADMVFNDVGFCWNDTGNGGCVDTQSIATHEEGHFLGLNHSSDRNATMTPYYVVGSSMRTIEDDDIEGVCALYPIGGTTAAGATSAASGGGGCDNCTNGSLAGACKAPYDECGASLACRGFIGCISGCQDDACAERCVNENSEGADLYISILGCLCNDCSTECSAECVGIVDGGGGGGGAGGGGGGGGGSSASTSSSAGGGATVGATASSSIASGGGVGGAGGADPTGGDTPKSGDDASGGDSGCSCSTTGRSADLGGVALLGVVGALASRRRRRPR
ncbi:matrixin family metalloprotease [Sorangium sp. So ce1000]|uniref:matrixin family metalloprotease n=1 Tax=Sorangium sp. So ce1000 TaxID=3133325 RepID=UPI003F62CBFA